MTLLLFIFDSPLQWLIVIAAFVLLFGANKLPELAKSLGQARKEFKKGMIEAEEGEKKEVKDESQPALAEMNDEDLIREIQRRKAKQIEQSSSN